jgi:hypothetical protein
LAAVFRETSILRRAFVRPRNERGFDMRSVMSAAVFAAVAMGCMGAAHGQVPGSAIRTAYVVEPFTPPSTITIQGTGVRLRNEPFTQETQILSHGSTGLPLTVVGIARLPDWNWYQVILKSGQKAFIRSDYTSAPSKGGGAVAPAPQLAAPPTQLATPLPPPSRIDYGTPSSLGTPATVSAPVPLTPPEAQPVHTPAPSYTPPPTYTPPAYTPPSASRTPTPAYTPPAPVPPSTPPSGGSAISLVPTSPVPSSAPSPNSGGLSSVDPR